MSESHYTPQTDSSFIGGFTADRSEFPDEFPDESFQDNSADDLSSGVWNGEDERIKEDVKKTVVLSRLGWGPGGPPPEGLARTRQRQAQIDCGLQKPQKTPLPSRYIPKTDGSFIDDFTTDRSEFPNESFQDNSADDLSSGIWNGEDARITKDVRKTVVLSRFGWSREGPPPEGFARTSERQIQIDCGLQKPQKTPLAIRKPGNRASNPIDLVSPSPASSSDLLQNIAQFAPTPSTAAKSPAVSGSNSGPSQSNWEVSKKKRRPARRTTCLISFSSPGAGAFNDPTNELSWDDGSPAPPPGLQTPLLAQHRNQDWSLLRDSPLPEESLIRSSNLVQSAPDLNLLTDTVRDLQGLTFNSLSGPSVSASPVAASPADGPVQDQTLARALLDAQSQSYGQDYLENTRVSPGIQHPIDLVSNGPSHLGPKNASLSAATSPATPNAPTALELPSDLPAVARKALDWKPHPELCDLIVDEVTKCVERMPDQHLIEPWTGEIFEHPDAAEERLQDWAFSQGFAVSKTSSPDRIQERFIFKCIHHGKTTQNNRQLVDLVVEEGNRKKERTFVYAKDCRWACRLAYIQVQQRKAPRHWKLTVTEAVHNHEMAPNPFSYDVHKNRMPEAAEAYRLARELKMTGESWRTAARRLGSKGLSIDRKKYDNIRRSLESSAYRQDEFLGGIETLCQDLGFEYRPRYSYTLDPNTGDPTHHNLEQIVFWLPVQKEFTQRWICDFMAQIDATFNTERSGLLLGVMTGVSNTGASFQALLSYQKSESFEAWIFFLKVAGELWGSLPPRVILSDQGAGLIAALPESNVSQTRQQFCQWHVAENIIKRVERAGAVEKSKKKTTKDGKDTHAVQNAYTAEQRYRITGRKRPAKLAGLEDNGEGLIWKYLKSETTDLLQKNRTELMDALLQEDREFMKKNWVPLETQLITCHVSQLPNLGCMTTQRGEGGNRVIKGWTDHQKPLEDAFVNLKNHILTQANKIMSVEAKEAVKGLRTINLDAWKEPFSEIADLFTAHALERVKVTYQRAVLMISSEEQVGMGEDCPCTEPRQYGLPCVHHLLQCVVNKEPIPKELLHVRWLKNRKVAVQADWTPSFMGRSLPQSLPKQLSAYDRFQLQVSDLGDHIRELPPPDQEQYLQDFVAFGDRQKKQREAVIELRGLPAKPFAPPLKGSSKRALKQAKQHGKANLRMTASAEDATRQADKDLVEVAPLGSKHLADLPTVQPSVSPDDPPVDLPANPSAEPSCITPSSSEDVNQEVGIDDPTDSVDISGRCLRRGTRKDYAVLADCVPRRGKQKGGLHTVSTAVADESSVPAGQPATKQKRGRVNSGAKSQPVTAEEAALRSPAAKRKRGKKKDTEIRVPGPIFESSVTGGTK